MRIRQSVKRSMLGARDSGTNPASVSGLVGYWSADSGVYQDGAAQFTSSHSDYLSVASNSTLQTGVDFWWACWVYLDTNAATTQNIINKYGAAANVRDFVLYTGGSRFNVIVSNGTTPYTVTANTFGAPTTSTWYFLMAYWDSVNNAVKLSVNGGAFDSTSTTGTAVASSSPLYFGTYDGTTSFYNGRLDSVGFGKSPTGGIAAAATTIRDSLYNSGVGKLYADLTSAQKTDWGLVSWWDLGEETGIRYDAHGTNHLAENTTSALIGPSTANGGFETAGAGGADVFGTWSELTAGTSTINRDTTTVHSGSAACRFDVDGSNSTAAVYRLSVLSTGRRYSYSLWAKASAGTPSLYIGNDPALYTLGVGYYSHTLDTTYTQYNGVIRSQEPHLYLQRNSAASKSIYVDDLTLAPVDIRGTSGIAASLAIDVNFAAQLNGSTQYMQDPGTGGDYDCNGQNMVLAAWVYLDFKGAAATPHFISKYQSGVNRNYRLWYDVSADRFNFGVYNTGAAASQELAANTHGAVSIGTWYLVVAYYDTGGTMGISVNNGAFDTTAVAFSPTSGGGNFVVGQDGLLLNGWPGRIDSVAFARPSSATSTRAASIASAMYNGGSGAKYNQVSVASNWGLMHWWDNEESSGAHVNRVTSGQDLVNTGTITRIGGVNYIPGLVSKWVDQSSSALNWVQTTVTKRPAYVTTGLNNRPALWFDGVDDVMQVFSAGALSTQDRTIFVVVTIPDSATTRMFFAGGTTRLYIATDSTEGNLVSWDNAVPAQKTRSIASGAGSKVHAARWLVTGGNPDVTLWVNGTSSTTSYADGVTTPSFTTFQLGALNTTGANSFDGYIAELAIYNVALTDVDVARIITYYRTKYGI